MELLNLITEAVQLTHLKLINREINKRYPRINFGGCGVFAKAFHEVTGYPIVHIFDEDGFDQDPPLHVLIELPNGKLYDGARIIGDVALEDEFNYEFPNITFVEDPDGSILDNHYSELGSGLSTTCHQADFEDIKKIIQGILNQ